MEQRLSLITLGVADVPAARAFYEALGWRCDTDPSLDVAFFQLGGIALAVWDRWQLAEDSTVTDRGGFGGVTLAYNVRSPEEVDAALAEAEAAGATIGRPGRRDVLGRLLRRLRRPRRPPVGGRPQPALDDRGRRVGADLDPALLVGDPGRLGAARGAEPRHGGREVVAHGPGGQVDVARRSPGRSMPARTRRSSSSSRSVSGQASSVSALAATSEST